MHDLRINIFLAIGEGDYAPEGPGWYLDIRRNDGQDEIAPRVHISPKDAEKIGLVLDKLIEGKTLNYDPSYGNRVEGSVRDAIIAANASAKEELGRALNKAEKIAQQIAELRKRVGEFDG